MRSVMETIPPRRETEFKVVELSIVEEEEIERALNQWTARGWGFESLHFAMWEGSKRPSMAFLIFTRPAQSEPSS